MGQAVPFIIDPIGGALGAAGVDVPFSPYSIANKAINPPKAPQPQAPPERQPMPTPGAPQVVMPPPPPPPPPPPAPAPQKKAPAYQEGRTGAGGSADLTRGLIPRGGVNRTMLS